MEKQGREKGREGGRERGREGKRDQKHDSICLMAAVTSHGHNHITS